MSLLVNSDRRDFKEELLAYKPTEVEKAFKKRMLFLLDNYANCFERSLEHAHFTASAWIVNESMTHALLTHHAKLDRWLQIGGHADGDENLARVALKEVAEESGLKDISFINKEVFDLDIHLIPEHKGIPPHDHYDVRFLIMADMKEPLTINHESEAMRWLKLSEVNTLVDNNDSINRMINKTLQLKINNKV